MSKKQAVYVGTVAGSMAGSYIPLLWGASELSFSSLIFGAIGAIVGIYIGFKMGE
jgi:uncharacterized membrane protein YeaQ/YmgE (transglycosylase-associated protein family)